MSNQTALASLAMDLRRVAIGYHRGSLKMAERFFAEAVKRTQEIDATQEKPYIQKFLEKITLDSGQSPQERAEELLLYSILFQNAAFQKMVIV
jgi:hypothetical protein